MSDIRAKSNLKSANGRFPSVLLIITLGVMLFLAPLLSTVGISEAIFATTNISNTSGVSFEPVIASSGSNVYVAWTDDTSGDNDIMFTVSNDGGTTFGGQVTFDDGGGTSSIPRIASFGANVYLAWIVDGQVFFTSSTDNGSTFSNPMNLSSSSSSNPVLGASGDNVYVSWVYGPESSSDIVVAVSNDTGTSFSAPLTFADDGPSFTPKIAASGSNVYLAWNVDIGNNEIYFAASIDGGSNFGIPVNLSSNAGNSITPTIAASGSTVYVGWADTSPAPGVLVAVSSDSGATFAASPTSLSVGGLFAQVPSLAISEATGDVYVAWQLFVDIDNGVIDIFFASSNDTASTFSEPSNLSENPGLSTAPIVASSSSGIFVVWRDDFVDPTNNEILATFSDDGSSFASPQNLSNSPDDTFSPGIAITNDGSGAAVFVMYEAPSDGSPSDIFFQKDVDFAETGISIDSVSNSEPRWDVDTVSVSGTASNVGSGDTVVVDWGDGSSTPGIVVSGGAWGPADHTYSSDAIQLNPLNITARLVDSSDVTIVSSEPSSITVLPHDTLLELDPIFAVFPETDVTISGTLLDAATSAPISGEILTLDGTGVESLGLTGDITTDVDGKFLVTGPSSNITDDGWTVQAHYGGSAIYGPVDSPQATYATLSPDATELAVNSGQNVSVDLTNLSFNASITFEDVAQAGSIFVSECTTPPSDRYLEMGICANINSALLLADGTSFAFSASYANKTIPDGFTANDIDAFHLDALGSVTDITQSRDLGTKVVTGEASSFSEFIIGIALHSAEPDGAFRQQVYVSQEPDNIVNFRDITNTGNTTAQISLDKNSYNVGDTVTLTIIDPEGNVDSSDIDIVSAGVLSETSKQKDPTGILITLQESATNSGVFEGTFTLTSGTSSGTSLEAQNGDELTVAYNLPARAQIVLDGVQESGLLQLSDSLVPQDAAFTPYGGAINASLVDTQLSEGARVRVTMSYANANIGNNDPALLRLLQEVEEGVWIDITELDIGGNVIGVDTDAKTVTGETGTLGSFSIGGNVGIIGGAGGGLSRPGSGFVVDAIASIASRSSQSSGHGGAGGGSGGASGFASMPVAAGQGSISEFRVGANSTVKIEFSKVTLAGSIYLNEMQISDLPSGSFLSSSFSQGIVDLDGSEAQTTGKIYDITLSSGFGFEPPIYVTLPYDENAMNSSETNIRLVHYVGGSWEDATVSINTTANTVTGKLDSLSPLVAAIVSDGTFGSIYFEDNPLSNISVEGTELGSTESASNSIVVTLKNPQRFDQHYTVLAQTLDRDGIVVGIGWTSETLPRAGSGDVTVDLRLADDLPTGRYSVQVMFVDDIESPAVVVLAPQSWANFEVVL